MKGGLKMFRDLLQKYRELSEALVEFQRHKDEIWETTMKNDKRCMQMETEVWYLNWRVKYLTKLIYKAKTIEDLKKKLEEEQQDISETSKETTKDHLKKRRTNTKEKSND